jgi:hypothetical protein
MVLLEINAFVQTRKVAVPTVSCSMVQPKTVDYGSTGSRQWTVTTYYSGTLYANL